MAEALTSGICVAPRMAGEISASRLSEARNAVSIARALHTQEKKNPPDKKGLVLILFISYREGGTLDQERTLSGNNFAMARRAPARLEPGRAEKRRLVGGSKRPLPSRGLDAIRRATRPTPRGRRRTTSSRLLLPSSLHHHHRYRVCRGDRRRARAVER